MKIKIKNYLFDIPIDEITSFLYNVGQNWKQRDYIRRTVYERNLVRYLGLSKKTARTEADWIAMYLCSGFRLLDILNIELGSWQILDPWILREEVFVRAFPRGRVLHIAPSNVQLSIVISILRALLTKNTSLVKMSANDPFTPTALVQSLADVDPKHPVTTSISVCYWPTEEADLIGQRFAAVADTIIAWGGNDAVTWARNAAGPNTELIAFGPKRSMAIIAPSDDILIAAQRVAVDISMYDQQACFSTRDIFVHRSCYASFSKLLAEQINNLSLIMPKGLSSFDEISINSFDKMHNIFFDTLIERCSVST
jgi:long-chain-fatty-acyl-CoA reductase